MLLFGPQILPKSCSIKFYGLILLLIVRLVEANNLVTLYEWNCFKECKGILRDVSGMIYYIQVE